MFDRLGSRNDVAARQTAASPDAPTAMQKVGVGHGTASRSRFLPTDIGALQDEPSHMKIPGPRGDGYAVVSDAMQNDGEPHDTPAKPALPVARAVP